jgi:hypothetical protein
VTMSPPCFKLAARAFEISLRERMVVMCVLKKRAPNDAVQRRRDAACALALYHDCPLQLLVMRG